MRSSVSVLLSTFLLGAFVAGGCSKAGNGTGDGGGPNGDGGGGNGDMAVVDPAHGLVITPANPVLTVVPGASPQTVQLMASRDGQSVAVRWSVDRGEIGGIDSAGLFTTTTSSVPGSLGGIGGVARVTAIDSDNYRATTTVTVKLTASDNGDP